MSKTYALVIAASGIFAKTFTLPVPQESGVVGFIESEAEALAVGENLKLEVDVTITKTAGGVNGAATVNVGPIKEAFDVTEHIAGLPELLVDAQIGSGRTETVVADVVETS